MRLTMSTTVVQTIKTIRMAGIGFLLANSKRVISLALETLELIHEEGVDCP
jgi:hypothetical protein